MGPQSNTLSPPQREIIKFYEDPLEIIWLHCARQIGWKLQRSHQVFASWNGVDTLTLGTRDDLDADDHLAQMILHEICHALIEGKSSWTQRDWGLENIDEKHLVNELSCHRLQAALADQVGLRGFFAVTTDWRPYFNVIPKIWFLPQSTVDLQSWATSFQKSEKEARQLDLDAIRYAQIGMNFLRLEHTWHIHIHEALHRTEQLMQLITDLASPRSLWYRDGKPHSH